MIWTLKLAVGFVIGLTAALLIWKPWINAALGVACIGLWLVLRYRVKHNGEESGQ